MKKIISKILIIFIIILILFEFVYSSNISFAILTLDEETINFVTNLAGGVVSIVYWPKRITAVALAFIFDILTANVGESSGINFGTEGVFSIITPFDIFFNKYKLLDINFFDIDGAEPDTLTYTFRTTVSGWYYVMRLIAAGILLVILIYVGIRMALSTVADEKAKYKKMLYDWVCSVLLIFVLQYISLFIIYSNNAIVEALRTTLSDSTVEDSIGNMIIDIGLKGILGVGIPSIVSVIVFVFIVFQTIAFLIAYITRMIKVGFLIIISPLISLTYSIDKMGDGKAQALGNWLKEFTYTILIQPFHCIMYLAFVRTAFSLIIGDQDVTIFTGLVEDIPALFTDTEFNQLVNGVLAILCLKFIKEGENIVRKIFGFQDDNSSTSFAAGMAASMIAVKNAKKIGATARKGVNFAKSKAGSIGTALSRDSSRLVNNNLVNSQSGVARALGGLGKGIGQGAQWMEKKGAAVGKSAKNLKNKFNNSLVGTKISGAKSMAGKFKNSNVGKFFAKHNSISSTLGLMGAAMAYSSGSTGALEAFGMGAAIQEGAGEYFNSSEKNLAEGQTDFNEHEDAKELDELGDSLKSVQENLKEQEGTEAYEKAKAQFDNREPNMQNKQLAVEKAQEKVDNIQKELKNKNLSEGARKNKEQELKDAEQELKNAEKELEDAGKNPFNRENEKAEYDIFEMMKHEQYLNEQIANFYTPEAIESRINSRRTGTTKSELQAKKNAIIQRLTELKLKDKASGDNNEENVITPDEFDSIERTAEKLMDNITHGVLIGQGFSKENQRALVQQSLGLKSKDTELSKEFYAATSEFESAKFNDHKAEAYNLHASYGGEKDSLVRKEIAMLMDRYRAQGKYKSTEHST